MIRVAMLSFWHVHAKDYAAQASAHPDVEIAALWDDDTERGRVAAQRWGARFYDNLDDVLALPDIDGVIVDTPTVAHREVMTAAARAGKHIFTEKVLATTLRECNEIVAAVDAAGVVLMVSLPRLYTGYTAAIREILDQGLLGELTQVRTRLSHNGAVATPENPRGWLPAHFFNREQCGGGAMIDLGCHPMYLARLFLGLPVSVSATYGYVTGRAVEDNAVVTLGYDSGAIGVVEAGFVNRYSPFTIEVHGTEGCLLYGTPRDTLLVRRARLEDGQEWIAREALPPDGPMAFQQWVTHIQQGTKATENVRAAVDLTRLMEAANLSASSGQTVRLESLAE